MYATSVPTSEFFGRERELAALDTELRSATKSGTGRLLAIRGRRQVGKSRLVEHFAERSGVAYGVLAGMKGTPVDVQVRRAAETLRSSTRPLPALEAATALPPGNWYDLLSRLQLVLDDAPAILVIDEFPWANESSPGLDGLLQSLWDLMFARRPVLVLLIGSDEAMMDQLFEHDRPLFGRLDGNFVVEPFNPAETAQALGGSRSPVEVFDTQLITGGFPELVAHARRFRSTAALVEDALSRPHTLLADVAQINLAGELADGTNTRLVLEAVGADEIGVVNFSRIASDLGGGIAAKTAVSRATDILTGTKRILAVDIPAGDKGSRLKRYRVADPYLRFWFRFVEPQLRNIEVGRSDLAIAAFSNGWSTWRGKAIEPVVRDGVLRLAPHLDPPFDSIESVGGWWDRRGEHEYDIVGSARGRTPVAIGSIKWRERATFVVNDLARLAKGRAVIPKAGAARLVAVTPRGAASDVGADLVLDAADLLSAWQL
jgi:AAA+ ATPase superfamily predicted ATPase